MASWKTQDKMTVKKWSKSHSPERQAKPKDESKEPSERYIFVKNMKANNRENLMHYIEAGTGSNAIQDKLIYNEAKCMALVVLDSRPDMYKLNKRVEEKPLCGDYISVSEVGPPSAIAVSSEGDLKLFSLVLYFESAKNGGGEVDGEGTEAEDKSCYIIRFKDARVVQSVCGRSRHHFERQTLRVSPCYECKNDAIWDTELHPVPVQEPISIQLPCNQTEFVIQFCKQMLEAAMQKTDCSVCIEDETITLTCTLTPCLADYRKQLKAWPSKAKQCFDEFIVENLTERSMTIQEHVWQEHLIQSGEATNTYTVGKGGSDVSSDMDYTDSLNTSMFHVLKPLHVPGFSEAEIKYRIVENKVPKSQDASRKDKKRQVSVNLQDKRSESVGTWLNVEDNEGKSKKVTRVIAPSRRPMKQEPEPRNKEIISNFSWRDRQELILRELGPVKTKTSSRSREKRSYNGKSSRVSQEKKEGEDQGSSNSESYVFVNDVYEEEGEASLSKVKQDEDNPKTKVKQYNKLLQYDLKKNKSTSEDEEDEDDKERPTSEEQDDEDDKKTSKSYVKENEVDKEKSNSKVIGNEGNEEGSNSKVKQHENDKERLALKVQENEDKERSSFKVKADEDDLVCSKPKVKEEDKERSKSKVKQMEVDKESPTSKVKENEDYEETSSSKVKEDEDDKERLKSKVKQVESGKTSPKSNVKDDEKERPNTKVKENEKDKKGPNSEVKDDEKLKQNEDDEKHTSSVNKEIKQQHKVTEENLELETTDDKQFKPSVKQENEECLPSSVQSTNTIPSPDKTPLFKVVYQLDKYFIKDQNGNQGRLPQEIISGPKLNIDGNLIEDEEGKIFEIVKYENNRFHFKEISEGEVIEDNKEMSKSVMYSGGEHMGKLCSDVNDSVQTVGKEGTDQSMANSNIKHGEVITEKTYIEKKHDKEIGKPAQDMGEDELCYKVSKLSLRDETGIGAEQTEYIGLHGTTGDLPKTTSPGNKYMDTSDTDEVSRRPTNTVDGNDTNGDAPTNETDGRENNDNGNSNSMRQDTLAKEDAKGGCGRRDSDENINIPPVRPPKTFQGAECNESTSLIAQSVCGRRGHRFQDQTLAVSPFYKCKDDEISDTELHSVSVQEPINIRLPQNLTEFVTRDSDGKHTDTSDEYGGARPKDNNVVAQVEVFSHETQHTTGQSSHAIEDFDEDDLSDFY